MTTRQLIMFVACAAGAMVVMAAMTLGVAFGLIALVRIVAKWRHAAGWEQSQDVRTACWLISLVMVYVGVIGFVRWRRARKSAAR